MRIGFNALCAGNRSGTGRYAAQLLTALAEIDRENEYAVLLDSRSPLRETLSKRRNFQLHPVSAGGPLRRQWFERYRLRSWIARQKVDLFHGPAFIVPRRCPVPSVVTVHDMVFKLFPKTIPRSRRKHYLRDIPRSVKDAGLVLCDSSSTAADVQRELDVRARKTLVVHLGVEARFFERPYEPALQRVREAHSLPEHFLLALGTLEPRKNIPNLLKAYKRLTARRPDTPDLVVAGRKGWGTRDLGAHLKPSSLRQRIHLPGFVADEDLPALYHLADLFVHVSRYEGFGLPVLEAMAAGTPVVAAANSSIPELVGRTALPLDADDPENIAEVLERALSDSAETKKRAGQALERALLFTWRQTAEKTLKAYETLYHSASGGIA